MELFFSKNRDNGTDLVFIEVRLIEVADVGDG